MLCNQLIVVLDGKGKKSQDTTEMKGTLVSNDNWEEGGGGEALSAKQGRLLFGLYIG